jgi:cell shape-determining protein MreD
VKHAVALLALGLVAVVVQGVLGTLVRPPWCPDLAFLVLLGVGLRWQGLAGGLLFAALLGYATDLVSGSLLGQHALLNLFAFSGTLFATRQLNLRGALPLAFFAVTASRAYGLAMLAITGFFIGGVEVRVGGFADQLIHAVVCGVFAPAVASAVGLVAGWAGAEDTGARPLGIDPSGRTA